MNLDVTSSRVALRYLDAEWERVAKPQYLKALDFVAGLIRKFDSRGQQVSKDATNQVLLRRVIQMRKAVQDGFDLGFLVANDRILQKAGREISERVMLAEREEEALLPDNKALAAFMKVYPDREQGARRAQANMLKNMISSELKLGRGQSAELGDLVMKDRAFFNEAFAVVNGFITEIKTSVSSLLSGAPGKFEIRDKAEQSTWAKSTRKRKVPFYLLGDLLGCRSITASIPQMAEACEVTQDSLEIVAKDNKFLDAMGGYNAVHYALVAQGLVVEYQVKALVNKIEAALSHELIYSDDKFRDKFKMDPLPASAKALVRRVIDISTQLSMRDLEKVFNLPLETSGMPVGDVLYGEDLTPEELLRRLKMGHVRRARFAPFS